MLFRIEIDALTGQQAQITQIAIKNAEGDSAVIDSDVMIPDGYEQFDPVADPMPSPVTIPDRISRRQGRLALLHAGYLPQVEAAMTALEDPTERMAAQIEYEAETWERANHWIDRTGAAIGLSAEQIDALFIAAAEL